MDGVWPTVIICAVLALIAALAIRSYVKKLRNGCCGAGGDSEKRLRPPDRELSHYPYAWRIKIDGINAAPYGSKMHSMKKTAFTRKCR